jgi:predicted RNA binding protein YcfA (HicA-like mRNA interferase family)
MNKKHRKTLEAIFKKPTQPGIPWKDIEALLLNLGATIGEGKGSRIRIELNNEDAVFHRPHPSKDTDKGAVASMRRFLENAGVKL